MYLYSLKDILKSQCGTIQMCCVYDCNTNWILEEGCSTEYACEHYSDWKVKRIMADGDKLILDIY